MNNLLFKSDCINFTEKEKTILSGNEYSAANKFILDLLEELKELEEDKAENEYFVMFVTFNNVIMAVKNCEVASLNQIKFTGEIDGLVAVAIVKISDFNYLFLKHEVDASKPKRQTGFIIDREIKDF